MQDRQLRQKLIRLFGMAHSASNYLFNIFSRTKNRPLQWEDSHDCALVRVPSRFAGVNPRQGMEAALGYLSSNFGPCFDVVSTTVKDSCRRWLPDIGGEEADIGNKRFRIIRQVPLLLPPPTQPNTRMHARTHACTHAMIISIIHAHSIFVSIL